MKIALPEKLSTQTLCMLYLHHEGQLVFNAMKSHHYVPYIQISKLQRNDDLYEQLISSSETKPLQIATNEEIEDDTNTISEDTDIDLPIETDHFAVYTTNNYCEVCNMQIEYIQSEDDILLETTENPCDKHIASVNHQGKMKHYKRGS